MSIKSGAKQWLFFNLVGYFYASSVVYNYFSNMKNLVIPRVADFTIDGAGKSTPWNKTAWRALVHTGKGNGRYKTNFKALYSETGIYFLFDCEDKKLTCFKTNFGDDIYRGDVVEVFLWPQEDQRVYFEYEISPIGVELPLLVSQAPPPRDTFPQITPVDLHGWLAWHFEAERKVLSATCIRGGEKKMHAAVNGWSAEFFIPFALLQGLPHCPPKPGAAWRANMTRLDWDDGAPTFWAWRWDAPEFDMFHNLNQFGTITFGE
jgi:hypothetical protein